MVSDVPDADMEKLGLLAREIFWIASRAVQKSVWQENSSVETFVTRAEPLQAVDGGQAGLGIVEGEKLPVHAAPVVRCGALQGRFGV